MPVKSNRIRYAMQVLILIIFILLWETAISLFNIPELLIPSPFVVFNAYMSSIFTGLMLWHTWITMIEIIIGFVVGSIIGIVLGYLLAKSKTLESALSPFIIAAQTTPKLALAPMFLIWFGFGLLSKIFITALIVFFALFINMLVAIRSVNPNLRDMMKLNHASRWQVFKKLEIPSSLPILFAGFKSGITLAIVGAVVGEFVGSNSGIGYLITFSMGHLDTPTVFAAIIQLIIMGVLFYEIISLIGSKLMKWHESEKNIY